MNTNTTKRDKMRLIAAVYLVVMCVQFVPLEGFDNSWIKIGLMALAPFLLIAYVPKPTLALIWGALFLAVMVACASLSSYLRGSTIGFSAMYLGMYALFYGLVYKNVFTIDSFIHLLRGLILAYFIFVVLQQFTLFIGLHIPFINVVPLDTYTKVRGLSIEPSHTARIMACLFYCYMYCLQLKEGTKLSIKQLFSSGHRKTTLSFLWVMLTIGSGTAFVALAILSLFFLSPRTLGYVVPLFGLIGIMLVSLNIENVQRILLLVDFMSTNDTSELIKNESSGAARILPIINSIQQFDFSSSYMFGNGTVEVYDETLWKEYLLTRKISIIEQYGFVTWLFSLIFVYKCCIRKVLSIETALFIVLLSINLGNIYYVWGIMMMFSLLKFFDK